MADVADRPTPDAPPPPRRLTHVLAWTTALLALPLISLGGLVTSTGAGMAVPDWPNSFGYNMFALPWGQWLGEGSYTSGVFQEHTHRLVGTAVGLSAVLLAGWAWFGERSQAIRTLATFVLLAIIVQGLMGGFRVTENSRLLSFLHGVFGQIVFATLAATVLVTSRWWHLRKKVAVPGGRTLLRLGQVGVALVIVQLLLGAAMRHDPARNHLTGSGAGLAVPDWPTSYGQVVPPVSDEGVALANAARVDLGLPDTTLGQVWLHTAHRVGAYTTAAVLLFTAVYVWRRRADLRGNVAWPVTVGALVLVQVTLGVVTVLWRKPAEFATAHQFVGALLLAATVVTALRSARAFAPAVATQPVQRDAADELPTTAVAA